MNELKTFRDHLDEVAATQLAQTLILSMLLQQVRRGPETVAALQEGAEKLRADLLGSNTSDYKIRVFDELVESYVERLS